MVQKQIQTLSPMMIQSMEVLQMGTQDLLEYVEDLAQENPVLELEDNYEKGQEAFLDLKKKLDWLQNSDRQNHTYYRQDDEDWPMGEFGVVSDRETLCESLLSQILTAHLSPQVEQGAVFLSESLNRAGWLDEPLPVLARSAHLPVDVMEAALTAIQALDPPGVGARTLSECLCLQLLREGEPDAVALAICREHLESLSKNRYGLIAKKLGVTVPRVRAAEERIRQLNPRPGSGFAEAEAPAYITPDLLVVWQYDHFEVVISDPFLPRLSLSRYYTQELEAIGEKEVQSYLVNKVRQAKWAIHSIEQRQSTVLSCAKCIVEAQEGFFRHGPGHLVPMALADVAQTLGIHESTVSRALKDKYLQCDKGVYPMTYFFSRKLGHTEGEGPSTDRAKALLRQLIQQEDKRKPLSDQKLADRMAAQGCPLARRTVAKYREEMNLPGISGRKVYE